MLDSMTSGAALLSQTIDEYVAWFARWQVACLTGNPADVPPPPAAFEAWKRDAVRSLHGEQPAVEYVSALHDQLHQLIRLALIKEGSQTEPRTAESIAEKYLALIHALRRFEKALAAAESDLDPLTGMRTRRHMQKDLEREIRRTARTHRPFFVVMADIDHFKAINDTHGHDNGDRVLAAFASTIIRTLRAHDDAYRTGGEEFLLTLKETDAAGCASALERLRTAVAAMPIQLSDGRTVNITASFGVTACKDDISIDALIKAADNALYQAKNDGRNCVRVCEA